MGSQIVNESTAVHSSLRSIIQEVSDSSGLISKPVGMITLSVSGLLGHINDWHTAISMAVTSCARLMSTCLGNS